MAAIKNSNREDRKDREESGFFAVFVVFVVCLFGPTTGPPPAG
jgi:hypothetical protein